MGLAFKINRNLSGDLEHNFFFKQEKKIIFLNPDDIVFLERKGNYSLIYTKDKKITKTRENLRTLKSRLNHKNFYQSHRSYIVNLKYIERIEPWGNRTYLISFYNTLTVAYMSRGFASFFFQEILKKDSTQKKRRDT